LTKATNTVSTTKDLKNKTAAAYNSAADFYDDPANSFWDRFGRRTIERLHIQPGARILDVCCGSGASAIPAAEKAGPNGFVLGIDLAENLLNLARKKSRERGLLNIEFRVADMLELGIPDSAFDAVVCVFGIFFVQDMPAAIKALWKVVRPGGQLAITTWGPRFFEPATTAFWDAVRKVRPDLYKGFNPWDRISDAESLRRLLYKSGVDDTELVAEEGSHSIPSPEAWWSAVLGSGYRGTVEQLEAEELDYVRAANMSYIRETGIEAVEANVVYAIASKVKG
jgi:ubiquinone/menaquinone biosynthesis C-methylase UbiE